MKKAYFEWDKGKDGENQEKHGVSFSLAQRAFLDPDRVIVEDISHSAVEQRFYCIGRVNEGIMTGIIGAGYWRKGRKIYEEQNKIH